MALKNLNFVFKADKFCRVWVKWSLPMWYSLLFLKQVFPLFWSPLVFILFSASPVKASLLPSLSPSCVCSCRRRSPLHCLLSVKIPPKVRLSCSVCELCLWNWCIFRAGQQSVMEAWLTCYVTAGRFWPRGQLGSTPACFQSCMMRMWETKAIASDSYCKSHKMSVHWKLHYDLFTSGWEI